MRAGTCFGLASAILLVGVVFVTLVLSTADDDAGFTMVLVASILIPSMLVAGVIAWVGRSIRAEQPTPGSG